MSNKLHSFRFIQRRFKENNNETVEQPYPSFAFVYIMTSRLLIT